MARPLKDGVDYFPKDTDFYSDDKIRLLRAEFGAKGMYILDYLLCYLYGSNGYFLKWDKNRCFLVSDGAGCGCSPEYISELINGCLRRSIFDKGIFDVFGVLTSAGIQRRYIRMFNSRDEIVIYKEFWLLDIDSKKDVPAKVLDKITFKSFKSTENPDKSTENPDKSTDNAQSKTKQNKTNKSNTNTLPSVEQARFEEFWNLYPKKRSKQTAEKAWRKIKPDAVLFEKIKNAVRSASQSRDWLKDNGKFIPYPATWLNAGAWDDVIECESEYPNMGTRL